MKETVLVCVRGRDTERVCKSEEVCDRACVRVQEWVKEIGCVSERERYR